MAINPLAINPLLIPPQILIWLSRQEWRVELRKVQKRGESTRPASEHLVPLSWIGFRFERLWLCAKSWFVLQAEVDLDPPRSTSLFAVGVGF